MPRKYTRRVQPRNATNPLPRSSCASSPPTRGHARRSQVGANPPQSEDNTTTPTSEAATTSIPVPATVTPQLLATSGPPPSTAPTSSLAPYREAMRAMLTPVTSLSLVQFEG